MLMIGSKHFFMYCPNQSRIDFSSYKYVCPKTHLFSYLWVRASDSEVLVYIVFKKSSNIQYFFRTFGDYTATLTDGDAVDLYIGWVWDNNAFGTTGIAYLGTVCDGAKYRTSLNEYFMTDLQTAQVLI